MLRPLRSRRAVLALGSAVLSLAACGRAAYREVLERRAFVDRGTLAQRATQIRRASTAQGWITEDVGPGLIRATLRVRTHSAIVDVAYDDAAFEVRYVGSTNLNAGEYRGDYIHPSYNRWVRDLQRGILIEPVT